MSSPYSSPGVFASSGGSTVKVYSDRVVSTMQAPPFSSPSRGQGTSGPSGSISKTVYFPSSHPGHVNLGVRVFALEEEVDALRSDLLLIKGILEAQEAKKQLLEERHA